MARQTDNLPSKCITPPNKKTDPFTNDVSSDIDIHPHPHPHTTPTHHTPHPHTHTTPTHHTHTPTHHTTPHPPHTHTHHNPNTTPILTQINLRQTYPPLPYLPTRYPVPFNHTTPTTIHLSTYYHTSYLPP
ncbi:hypothetical protein BON23_5293 [Saccharomyces cerevisiae]|nr:hypothetical protein BON23_5293 [Saccharomyces cerevisiae]